MALQVYKQAADALTNSLRAQSHQLNKAQEEATNARSQATSARSQVGKRLCYHGQLRRQGVSSSLASLLQCLALSGL